MKPHCTVNAVEPKTCGIFEGPTFGPKPIECHHAVAEGSTEAILGDDGPETLNQLRRSLKDLAHDDCHVAIHLHVLCQHHPLVVLLDQFRDIVCTLGIAGAFLSQHILHQAGDHERVKLQVLLCLWCCGLHTLVCQPTKGQDNEFPPILRKPSTTIQHRDPLESDSANMSLDCKPLSNLIHGSHLRLPLPCI